MKATAVGIVLMAAACGAHAQSGDDSIKSDRPGIADSSEVIGARRFQIETGVTREAHGRGEDPERKIFLPTLVRLGITDRFEVRFETDLYAWMRGPDGEPSEAFAPASLGFKYQFMEAEGMRPSLGVIARASPPSGTRSLRSRHTTWDVRLAADWELGEQWSLNPNIGVGTDEDGEGERFTTRLFATTLAYRPVRTLELFLDAAAQRPEAPGGRSAVIYDAGLAYLLRRDVQVDFSVGVRGSGSTPPRSFVSAGLSVRF